jgi:hypothetical protein
VSVIDSREERAEATARLTTEDDAALERDLVHWTLASFESARQYGEVSEQLGALRLLHAEEETWIRLIADEIAARRARRRQIQ